MDVHLYDVDLLTSPTLPISEKNLIQNTMNVCFDLFLSKSSLTLTFVAFCS